jgi:Spirocyclase AveC-like
MLWCLPAYIFLGLGAALVGSALLRRLRPRLPRMSRAGLFAIVLAAFYAVAFALESLWTRADVYNYVSVPSELTLWAGTGHQLPVYSPLLLALYCLAFTVLRESRDDRGRCMVDRDLDDLRVGPRAKSLASILAVCGYAFLATLFAYQVPWSWLAMRGDTAPVLPSYMRDGVYCGQPGQPLCAGQYLEKLRDQHQGG